jgi:hypothetical protein
MMQASLAIVPHRWLRQPTGYGQQQDETKALAQAMIVNPNDPKVRPPTRTDAGESRGIRTVFPTGRSTRFSRP